MSAQKKKEIWVLGVETSCDETSCAVLKGPDQILSNVVSSSLFRHQPFGGVVPEIASRHCLEQIDIVFDEALRQAGIRAEQLDLIAVTQGPGLIGSLFVGVCFAKALSFQLNIPLIAVNHLEAHIAANFIGHEEPEHYVGLLVSGGHTMLSYHHPEGVAILGETVDDACGEAYDKTAKILGLGYPGGPIIDRLAKEGNAAAFAFTKPKQDNPLNFSFSGIKTAVLYLARKQPSITEAFQKDLAASFQEAVVQWLVEKSLLAAETKGGYDIVAGGGVSANSRLREALEKAAAERNIKVWFPPLSLTGDNAAMIARRGIELYQQGYRSDLKLTADPNLPVFRERMELCS